MFLSDIDKVFTQLQASLTPINVSGTIASPKYGSAGFEAIGGSLKELILGDARGERRLKTADSRFEIWDLWGGKTVFKSLDSML